MENAKVKDSEYVIENQLYHHHFQPIFDVQKLNEFGYEGLLRSEYIQNPELLFDTAIRTNKLYKLDTSSIVKALQTVEENYDEIQSTIHFFLNVYPSTLVSADFLDDLDKVIHSTAISPERIVLEINESETILNFPILKRAVYNLQSKGFKIALDDIGKGSSPFEKIIELQPAFIKLDKYFSADLFVSLKKQKMLKLFLGYCEDENVNVILEGIENEEELSIAKSLGVPFGQGYLLGRPDVLVNQLNR